MTIRSALEINPKVHIFYHSDGDIEEIIPDLIEIGVDVLNPIQPECMDPAAIKKKYGDRLALWGTIGIQHTMPFGTPEDVKQEVKERIATAGRGGGFVIAPSHEFEPEVPWENILAFFQAVEEYGKYD
jgi:uroporphyrinogen decarboxylase